MGSRTVPALLVLLAAVSCGGGQIRSFELTIRTVRNCHPAGLIPQLCDDSSTFAGRSRTVTWYLEQRGPSEFVLYDDTGRALPGRVERAQWHFARAFTSTNTGGCIKETEHNVKFSLDTDFVPTLPRLHEHQRVRMHGTQQDRAYQSDACGQVTRSKFEEAFEGRETTPGLDETPPGGTP